MDNETLRIHMDKKKQLDYLAEIKNQSDKLGEQIIQLKRQTGQLTQKKVDLDKEWREKILEVSATEICRPILAPKKSKKIDSIKKSIPSIDSALKEASPEALNKVAELLKGLGVEL